jgi:hypothetical protein
VGGAPVLFECEADFDEGFIRARIDGNNGDWVRHNLVVTDKTAVTWAWLDAYYGGPAVPLENMAWDISDYKLENLGVDLADPGIDWDAIGRMIAEKEEAAKETAASENPVKLVKDFWESVGVDTPQKPVDGMDETTPSLSNQLRSIADQIEALDS